MRKKTEHSEWLSVFGLQLNCIEVIVDVVEVCVKEGFVGDKTSLRMKLKLKP